MDLELGGRSVWRTTATIGSLARTAHLWAVAVWRPIRSWLAAQFLRCSYDFGITADRGLSGASSEFCMAAKLRHVPGTLGFGRLQKAATQDILLEVMRRRVLQCADEMFRAYPRFLGLTWLVSMFIYLVALALMMPWAKGRLRFAIVTWPIGWTVGLTLAISFLHIMKRLFHKSILRELNHQRGSA